MKYLVHQVTEVCAQRGLQLGHRAARVVGDGVLHRTPYAFNGLGAIYIILRGIGYYYAVRTA